jgi:hypothetical protein
MVFTPEQLSKAVDNKIAERQIVANRLKAEDDEKRNFLNEAKAYNDQVKALIETEFSDVMEAAKTFDSADGITDKGVKAVLLVLTVGGREAIDQFPPDFKQSWQDFVEKNLEQVQAAAQSMQHDINALLTDELKQAGQQLAEKQQKFMMQQMMAQFQPPEIEQGDALVLVKEQLDEEGEWLVAVVPVTMGKDYKVSVAKTFEADLNLSLHVRSSANRTLAEEFNAPSLFVPAGQPVSILATTVKAEGGNATIDVVGAMTIEGQAMPVLLHEPLFPEPDFGFAGPEDDFDIFGGPRGPQGFDLR